MKHQESFFKDARNAKICYQCWLPAKNVKAVLFVVHGLGEHSGRYMNLVNHFVPLGYAVYSLDHIGHGKSEGTREYVERFEDFTDTLKIYLNKVKTWQPGKPVFLVGHSLGGLIGCSFLVAYQSELKGAVLSGALAKVPGNITPITLTLGKLLSKFLPKFGLIGLQADAISRDPEVVNNYIHDPLVYTGKTTARLAAESLKAMQQVSTCVSQIKIPLLIVHGEKDKLVEPASGQFLYDHVSSTDKKIIIYEGLYHEVFNEPEHDKVLGDVESWLETHV